MSPVWVLMAWDGPRPNAESWEPIAMFAGVEEPSMLDRGRALIAAGKMDVLPWAGPRGECDHRPVRIDEVTSLRQIRDDLVTYR